MPPYAYDENGRRIAAPSKGELREKAILDEAEKQLVEVGADGMTVESIANAAGLTRGALYFYFRSKNDVLAALVERVTVELTGAVATRRRVAPDSPYAAIVDALELTADLWRRHGAVMRVAVELTPSVPVVAKFWSGARDDVVASVIELAVDNGVPTGRGPDDAPALSSVLVGMTERAFYDATVEGRALDDVTRTLATVWSRTLGLVAEPD